MKSPEFTEKMIHAMTANRKKAIGDRIHWNMVQVYVMAMHVAEEMAIADSIKAL